MNILHITCSPRGRASESHRLSQRIIERLADESDGAAPDGAAPDGAAPDGAAPDGAAPAIVEIDATRLPHVDQDYALALSAPADPADEVLNQGALRLSTELIQALQDATHIVIATPMHNFTVPSALKVWIDHVVRVRSTFRITAEGKIGNLPDRPVYVAVSSGGEYSGDAARQPDFLTPYLKHVLGTIGLHNVSFFSVQGTARGDAALQAARALAEAEIAAHPLATAAAT